MPFPFTILYTKPLRAIITDDNQQQVLHYIQKVILEKSAKNVIMEGKQVRYRGTTSPWRGALFGGVDSGALTLMNNSDKSYLTYGFKMYHLFITTGVMSVIAFAVSQLWWVGLGAFLWLGGMNWITNLIRHESLVNQLAFDIDKLLGIKEEESVDKERLKSWM